MSRLAWLLLAALPAFAGPLGVGRPADPAHVAARAITVSPDGGGLPAGRGTALEGRSVFAAQCAPCHGAAGEGSAAAPALAGGRGSLASDKPVKTVGSFWPHATTVWDYTRRAMPYQAPGSLSDDEVYAVTAFMLHLNGIVGEREVMDRDALPRVAMPNRDGFVGDPRPDTGPVQKP